MIRSADPTDYQSDDSGQPDDDRFFEAVRYLLDEMSPEEIDRFEEALAVDQSLREILAEAVLVTHAAYAAQLSPVESAERPEEASPHRVAPRQDPRAHPRENSSPATVLLALAATLLVAAVGSVWLALSNNSSDVAADPSHEDVQLASAWVERLEEQSQENATLWDDDLLASSPLDASSENDSNDALLGDGPMHPPAWMLKALAAQQEDDVTSPAM